MVIIKLFHLFHHQIPFFVNNKIIITSLQSGGFHNLCIDTSANIYSFGGNDYGQCGVGRIAQSINEPEIIKYLSKHSIIAIKCGLKHSFAKSDDGQHFLFGHDNHNQCSLTANNAESILIPFSINTTFAEITNNKMRIKDVYLGAENTFIIANEIKET